MLKKLSTFFVLVLCSARFGSSRSIYHNVVDIRTELEYAELLIRQSDTSGGSCSYPASCSPSSCMGSACYNPGVYQLNETLVTDPSTAKLKKRFENRPPDIGEYLQSLAISDGATTLVPANSDGYYYPTFCSQKNFYDVSQDSETIIGMGQTELTGCTVLTIVSARAVYMCHIWEDISFPPVNTAPSPRGFVGIQPFLNLMTGNGGATPETSGPALDTSLFNGGAYDMTWAFISTPRNRATPNDANSQEHPNEINQIAAAVRNLIPGVGIAMYNYATPPVLADGTVGQYANSYQGVALFQYDPNHSSVGPNWRLWYEAASENGRTLKQQPV